MKSEGDKAGAVQFATAIIIAHAAVGFLHAAGHRKLDIQLSQTQLFFIVIVITLAPLAAAVLLWKRAVRGGAALLLASMASSLVFGVYNHYVALSPDHVSHVGTLAQTSWALIFQITAALLALTETLGICAGIWILKKRF
jgi:Na+/proline symporter